MTTKKNECINFGKYGLKLIQENGESRETATELYLSALKITSGVSDRKLKTCEYLGGTLDIQTICNVRNLSIYNSPFGWNDPDRALESGWKEVITILKELAGDVPIRTHKRDRENWTLRWRHLYQRGDEEMRKDVIKTAKSRYKDFDIKLLE